MCSANDFTEKHVHPKDFLIINALASETLAQAKLYAAERGDEKLISRLTRELAKRHKTALLPVENASFMLFSFCQAARHYPVPLCTAYLDLISDYMSVVSHALPKRYRAMQVNIDYEKIISETDSLFLQAVCRKVGDTLPELVNFKGIIIDDETAWGYERFSKYHAEHCPMCRGIYEGELKPMYNELLGNAMEYFREDGHEKL